MPARVTDNAPAAQPKRTASSAEAPSASAAGEGAVEGIAGARGLDDGAGIEGRDVRAHRSRLDERAALAERDDGGAHALGEEAIGCRLGLVEVAHRHPGQHRGLGLVRGQEIDTRVHRFRKRRRRRRVEHRGHTALPGDFEPPCGGHGRDLHLGHEHRRAGDALGRRLDLGRGDRAARAGDDDDRVLAASRIDEDPRRARGLLGSIDEVARRDPLGGRRAYGPYRQNRRVRAWPRAARPRRRAAPRRLGSSPCRRGPIRKSSPNIVLAHRRHAAGDERKIGHEGAEDRDRSGGALTHG